MSIVVILAIACIVSYINYNVAQVMISEYDIYQKLLEYDLHNLDYLAVMLGSTDSSYFPFIDTSSYVVLVPTFSFYVIGLLLTSWRFIRLDSSYHVFLLARLPTQKHFFAYLQQGMNKKVVLYCFSYTVISYYLIQLLAPYPKASLSIEIAFAILLFTLSRMVLLVALTQVMLIIYLKKEAIIAQFSLLFIMLLSLTIGMNSNVVNIVFYNPNYYFLPSFAIAIMIIISTSKKKTAMTYQMIERK